MTGEAVPIAPPRCHPPSNLMDEANLGVSACQGRPLWAAAPRRRVPRVLEKPRPQGRLAGMRFKAGTGGWRIRHAVRR